MKNLLINPGALLQTLGWKTLSAIAALIAICLFTSYWAYGASVAKKEVRRTLSRLDLRHNVDYQEVVFNPLSGNVTLKGVELSLGSKNNNLLGAMGLGHYGRHKDAEELKIDAIEFRDFANERDHLLVDLSIKGVQLHVPTAVKLGLPGSTKLLKLGYEKVTPDIDIKIDHDKDMAEGEHSIRIQNDSLGELELDIALHDTDTMNIKNLGLGLFLGRNSGSAFKEAMGKVSVSELTIDYTDYGLMARATETARRAKIRQFGDEDEPLVTEEAVDDFVVMLIEAGVDDDMAEEFVDTLASFANDPDEFHISTDIDHPVRISRFIENLDNKPQRAIDSVGLSVGT